MMLWKQDKNTYSPVTGSHSGPLPAGVYTSYQNMNGERLFYKYETNTDAVYELPGLPVDFILSQLTTFWAKTTEYKKYGFLQKRGIMLYGPAGCGKSSIVGLIRKNLLDMDGIVFVPMSGTGFSGLSSALAAFRELEPDRPIMTLVEDIETLLESSNGSLVAEKVRKLPSHFTTVKIKSTTSSISRPPTSRTQSRTDSFAVPVALMSSSEFITRLEKHEKRTS